jgi:hypothetical protein
LQVSGLATTAGVSVASLVELLGRCLGLVSVPAEVLGAGLANMGLVLGVKEEEALDMVLAQPTLLAAQVRQGSSPCDAEVGVMEAHNML